MRRRIHACHMRRRIHACHMRKRIHACHMRRRIHAASADSTTPASKCSRYASLEVKVAAGVKRCA